MSTEHGIPVLGTGEQLRTLQQTTGAGNVQVEVVTDSELTVDVPVAVSVTGTSAEIVAASTGIRHVVLSVPTSADTGIYVNFGAAATSSNFLIESGGALKVNTPQQIRAIRAGSSNVTAYVMTGAPP